MTSELNQNQFGKLILSSNPNTDEAGSQLEIRRPGEY